MRLATDVRGEVGERHRVKPVVQHRSRGFGNDVGERLQHQILALRYLAAVGVLNKQVIQGRRTRHGRHDVLVLRRRRERHVPRPVGRNRGVAAAPVRDRDGLALGASARPDLGGALPSITSAGPYYPPVDDLTLDPDKGGWVAAELKSRGVRGILITAAQAGHLTELACQMPTCFCPEELGGPAYFEDKTSALPDWMPTVDHRRLKRDGGHLTFDNVRLAHRLCNRIDYSINVGRPHERDLARVEAAQLAAVRQAQGHHIWFKVVVWNMDFKRASKNWQKLKGASELACDVALLNEATPPPANIGIRVASDKLTVGRDDTVHGGKKTRRWAAMVASPFALAPPQDVWALPSEYKDRRSKLTASRPGSWSAAVVSLPDGEPVTAISLYGLLDERSDASVHRSLSDLTPLLEDKRYNRYLLLGGDLNTLCTAPAGTARLARDQGVLDRITRGFGLVDLLRESLRLHEPRRGRLKGCTCSLGNACLHTRTYRMSGSRAPHQDDYLFASPALAHRLIRCTALPFTIDWPSDHVPIIATFR